MSVRVGFIGLGIMGEPMARHILQAGYHLIVYNRTAAKAENLVSEGAVPASSPKEVAEQCDVTITMVTGPDDVHAVILGEDGVIHGVQPDDVVIDMSTITAETVRSIGAELQQRGVHMLDAPVSGGDIGAREGTLSVMVGGEERIFRRCQPLFQVFARRIVHVGPLGAGQIAKMANQILVGLTLLGVTEALRFVEEAGVSPEKVLAAVGEGAAASWQLHHLAPRMLQGDFAPGFTLQNLTKDIRQTLQTADDINIPLHGTELLHEILQRALAQGLGSRGTQALYAVQPRPTPQTDNEK